MTLATQELSEFALHVRAILGLPVRTIHRVRAGASAALRAGDALETPTFSGISDALEDDRVSLRLFGKPVARPKRRMGVVLAWSETVEDARARARAGASKIRLTNG